MHSYIQPLTQLFKQHADPQKAAGAKAYLRNQFEFFGIASPLRRSLCKEYMHRGRPPYNDLSVITKELWLLPEREYQYFAIELTAVFSKQEHQKEISIIEYMITHKPWWDTVDYICSALAGPYFKVFTDQVQAVTPGWNHSENTWLQRSSLLFQKNYKQQLDKELLTEYILHLAGSKEFFVQKAIGWVLREYAKTNPSWVKAFVSSHQLTPLSRREALKRL